MKKHLIAVLLALNTLCGGIALAQDGSDCWTGGLSLGNNSYLCSRSSNGQTSHRLLKTDSTDNVHINIPSGKKGFIEVAQTPVATISSTGIDLAAGKAIRPATNSVTFKSTPTPTVDLLVVGYNIPAGTPTASTIARLPASPAIGDVVDFYNVWTASLKVQANGSQTLNGTGTNGTIVVATKIGLSCKAITAGTAAEWDCRLGTNPTAAA